MNLNEMGFRFAFTIENYIDNEARDDPAYVKFIVRMFTNKGGVKSQRSLSYHECNDTDWEDFAPAAKGTKTRFEAIRDSPKRGFKCIDWPDDEPHVIYGDQVNDDNNQYLSVVLVPCTYLHTEFGQDYGDYIREECKSDLQSQIEYLGNLNVLIYATSQAFQFDEFGNESVKTESTLFGRQVNEKSPNWLDTRVQ